MGEILIVVFYILKAAPRGGGDVERNVTHGGHLLSRLLCGGYQGHSEPPDTGGGCDLGCDVDGGWDTCLRASDELIYQVTGGKRIKL